MFYLLDLAARVTDATLLVVGLALMLLVLFAPRGLLGVAPRPRPAHGCREPARGPRPPPQLRRPRAPSTASTSTSRDGEIHALIGPNGAGKTTLVSLLCGRLIPDAGSITFMGRDITRLPAYLRARLGIAYTFQITAIFPRLPVFDNVALAVQRRGVSGLAAETHAALARVGLDDRAAAARRHPRLRPPAPARDRDGPRPRRRAS